MGITECVSVSVCVCVVAVPSNLQLHQFIPGVSALSWTLSHWSFIQTQFSHNPTIVYAEVLLSVCPSSLNLPDCTCVCVAFI